MSDALTPPPFDPSKPFTTIAGAAPPPFDPSKPFTAGGSAPSGPDDSYTGFILPIRRDREGLHLAVPEIIAGPARGAEAMGERAMGVGEAGKDPTRPLAHEELGTLMALGGSRVAGMADRGMLGP